MAAIMAAIEGVIEGAIGAGDLDKRTSLGRSPHPILSKGGISGVGRFRSWGRRLASLATSGSTHSANFAKAIFRYVLIQAREASEGESKHQKIPS